MKLEGIHHITAITEDGQRNADFYVGVLGLRMVKKTVNQDNPTAYHLFYADEKGDPGSDITFFEYPGIPQGPAGAGMIHQIAWRVGSEDAIAFWEERLSAHDTETEVRDGRLHFSDPEGLGHELVVVEVDDEPLIADHPEVPAELALQGFHAARAYSQASDASRALLEENLEFAPYDDAGFSPSGNGWEARGERRGGLWAYDAPPDEPGIQGAGSVHHIAWASHPDQHERWRERVIEGGASPTPVIDRYYFRSIYFREPSGVLFEIATIGPGFTIDEPLEHLGEKLSLPPAFEHLRPEVEPRLRPIANPRVAAAR